MKNLFYKKQTLKFWIFLTCLGLSTITLADSNQCDSIKLKCKSKHCPIPSFTLENIDGQFYTAGTISRWLGNKKVKVPYSISFSSNGDRGLVGSGDVDVQYNDGKDIVRTCSFSIPYFSIVKKKNGNYKVSYNLPNHLTSKVFIQDRQQSSETDSSASFYVGRDARIGVQGSSRNSVFAAEAGYAAGGSSHARQNNKDARQFQEVRCPSQNDRSSEVSLNLEYQAVLTQGCDLDTVIPAEFPYDAM